MIRELLGFLLMVFSLTACTAHYPFNQPISSMDSLEAFSLEEKEHTQKSEDILFLLTLSGGGTRAAAFSYGVLEVLAATNVMINGKPRRLIVEIDAISSISGGSFTAGYFGLFGDRIFEDFEDKFLKRKVQSTLLAKFFSPLNWPKLGSLYYNRSDLAAAYYDEILFENKTFKDFLRKDGPTIAINATDAALGSQFTFMESQFAPICSDLSAFPVSRAVTASSAVPGAFTSVILKNYSGSCGYQLPQWATKALASKETYTRRYHNAKSLKAYLDIENYPYIHLIDGGISDNLGVRTIINATLTSDDIWNKLESLKLEKTTKLVIIIVNSRNKQDLSFAKTDFPIPIVETLKVASSVSLDQYSWETMEILRNNLSHWQASITEGRCAERSKNTMQDDQTCKTEVYSIEVTFSNLDDMEEQKYLENLPTSLQLEPGDVDRLRKAAVQILQKSDKFQNFIISMQ
jgi:NTE family protein